MVCFPSPLPSPASRYDSQPRGEGDNGVIFCVIPILNNQNLNFLFDIGFHSVIGIWSLVIIWKLGFGNCVILIITLALVSPKSI
jgi:hypothetical protein